MSELMAWYWDMKTPMRPSVISQSATDNIDYGCVGFIPPYNSSILNIGQDIKEGKLSDGG